MLHLRTRVLSLATVCILPLLLLVFVPLCVHGATDGTREEQADGAVPVDDPLQDMRSSGTSQPVATPEPSAASPEHPWTDMSFTPKTQSIWCVPHAQAGSFLHLYRARVQIRAADNTAGLSVALEPNPFVQSASSVLDESGKNSVINVSLPLLQTQPDPTLCLSIFNHAPTRTYARVRVWLEPLYHKEMATVMLAAAALGLVQLSISLIQVLFGSSAKTTVNAAAAAQNDAPRFARRVSNDEYRIRSRHVTQRELTKLRQTDEYQAMVAQRGSDLSKWNWQIRQRLFGPNIQTAGRLVRTVATLIDWINIYGAAMLINGLYYDRNEALKHSVLQLLRQHLADVWADMELAIHYGLLLGSIIQLSIIASGLWSGHTMGRSLTGLQLMLHDRTDDTHSHVGPLRNIVREVLKLLLLPLELMWAIVSVCMTNDGSTLVDMLLGTRVAFVTRRR